MTLKLPRVPRFTFKDNKLLCENKVGGSKELKVCSPRQLLFIRLYVTLASFVDQEPLVKKKVDKAQDLFTTQRPPLVEIEQTTPSLLDTLMPSKEVQNTVTVNPIESQSANMSQQVSKVDLILNEDKSLPDYCKSPAGKNTVFCSALRADSTLPTQFNEIIGSKCEQPSMAGVSSLLQDDCVTAERLRSGVILPALNALTKSKQKFLNRFLSDKETLWDGSNFYQDGILANVASMNGLREVGEGERDMLLLKGDAELLVQTRLSRIEQLEATESQRGYLQVNSLSLFLLSLSLALRVMWSVYQWIRARIAKFHEEEESRKSSQLLKALKERDELRKDLRRNRRVAEEEEPLQEVGRQQAIPMLAYR